MLGAFDDVLSLVVLSLFFSPFSILDFLVGIDFGNTFLNGATEVDLFSADTVLLVSNGDLLSEFSIQLFNSLGGSFNFALEFVEYLIAIFLEGVDEFVILVLLVLELILSLLEHADQVLNWASSCELKLNGIKEGQSVARSLHLLDGSIDFLIGCCACCGDEQNKSNDCECSHC